MDVHPLRQRIVVQVPLAPEALQELLHERLVATPTLEGRIRRQAILVWHARPARRWWSPCLDLSVHVDGDGARLDGYACAQPQVMAFTVFGSIFLVFMGSFSAVWASVQWTMDESPRCLFGTGGALLGLAVVATAHGIGRRYADNQIHALTDWLNAALRSTRPAGRADPA